MTRADKSFKYDVAYSVFEYLIKFGGNKFFFLDGADCGKRSDVHGANPVDAPAYMYMSVNNRVRGRGGCAHLDFHRWSAGIVDRGLIVLLFWSFLHFFSLFSHCLSPIRPSGNFSADVLGTVRYRKFLQLF